MIWCPEQLMRTILSHIHYMPDEWQCHAHTTVVRDEFGNLFTYKFTHLLSEVRVRGCNLSASIFSWA